MLTALSLLSMYYLVVNTVGTINETYIALAFIAPYIFTGLPMLCVSLIGLASGLRWRRVATSPRSRRSHDAGSPFLAGFVIELIPGNHGDGGDGLYWLAVG